MFSSEAWLSNSSNFYNGVATQSVRLDDGSSAYLHRTPSSAGNRKTWTWSAWFKRCNLGLGETNLFSCYTASNNNDTFQVYLNGSDQLLMIGQTVSYRTLTQLFRDTSSWYHLVIAIDTTQGTADNRVKVYVNGQQVTSFTAQSNPSQNDDLGINQSALHHIGTHRTTGFFDAYMAEVNFIDGTQLDPTSFGETKNGVWIPIEYTGSYGTNGYRLQFNQTGTGTASSSTIGADTSGNDNHFSSSGIVASDCAMPDSPENNFATWNGVSSFATDNSEGNLKASASSGNANSRTNSTIPISSGKWYFEVRLDDAGTNTTVGIAEQASPATYPGQLVGDYVQELDNARKGNNNSFTSYGTSLTTGDIFNCAVDLDNGEIYFGKNGTYFNSSDPATNTSPAFSSIPSGLYTIVTRPYSSATEAIIVSLNAGQDSTFAGATTAGGNTDANGKGDFKYSVPSGYLALCTANLPEPTISPNADTQADDYFNTVLYTGTGSSNAITGVGFQPDWIWWKSRSSATSHALVDSTRGVKEALSSNNTTAEYTEGTDNGLMSFDSDGFTVKNDGNYTAYNASGSSIVAWTWKANGGITSSNTDGSITSTVQANTDAGFSIVTYTGTGSSATVGHGLGKKPSLIFIKRRAESSNWAVAGSVLGSTATLYLNLTNAQETYADPVIINTQTTTTFSIGTDSNRNKNTFEHIAYCFAEIEGYSKFGSYTGNGSADGTFVYTGFRPAWLMVKRTDTLCSWVIVDSVRDPINVAGKRIFADSSASEYTNVDNPDLVSNGFKVRIGSTDSCANASGGSYIYMAFADGQPFKYANAR